MFLPSLSHQARPPPAGRQRAPVTWGRSLGCACSAASAGPRARRDVLHWGRFMRPLGTNVPSLNIHPVAHSIQPDWGNGSRGCFTKGFSESCFLPTGLVRTDRTVPRSSLLRWLKQMLVAGSVTGSDLSVFPLHEVTCNFMLQVISEVSHREHISGSGCSIFPCEFLFHQAI